MKELIPLNRDNRNVPVSARDLHAFFSIKTEFSKWINRMLDYGFEEGTDYEQVIVKNDGNSRGGRSTLTDYAITIDTAKEISMLQRSEKGKQARQYFIECEKVAKQSVQINPSSLSRMDILQMAIDAEKENQRLLQVVEVQEKKLETKSAKEAFTDHLTDEELYTIQPTAIAGRLGLRSANELNKLLIELGIIRRLDPDYNMTSRYYDKKYGKRVVVKEIGGRKIEALRYSYLGEAFIVNKIKGLDRTKYKTQEISISESSKVIY